MKNLISLLMAAAHRFTAFDFAILKICLISIGILLGVYLGVFAKYIYVVWAIAAISFIAMLYIVVKRLPRNKHKQKDKTQMR